MMNKPAVLALAAVLCYAAPANADKPQTVAQVDIQRYMGTWHEIARLPMRFQDECARAVQARYTLNPDQSVRVDNSCQKADGSTMQAEGLAKAEDKSGSKLRVTFLPKAIRWLPVGHAQYWILRLDEQYQHALVGTPDRKYLWLLSRRPDMSEQELQSYLQTAREQGYDLKDLIRNPQ